MKLQVEFSSDLPENWVPMDSVAVVKCMSDEGKPALAVRCSEGLPVWEIVGMLVTAADAARRQFLSEWET